MLTRSLKGFLLGKGGPEKLVEQVKIIAQRSYRKSKTIGENAQQCTLSKAKYNSIKIYEKKLEDGSYKFVSIYTLEYQVRPAPKMGKENYTYHEIYYTVAKQPMAVNDDGEIVLSSDIEIDEEKSMSEATNDRGLLLARVRELAEMEVNR